MNLLFRFIRFLVLSVFQLLVVVMTTIFRFLVLVVLTAVLRFVLWPVLVAIMRLIWSLLFFSLTATVNGPRRFIDRLAGEWTERIYEGSITRDHLNEVFQLCRFLVGTLIVLGWLVSGFFTYQILRVVFGFFT